jgi:hypothetical protein
MTSDDCCYCGACGTRVIAASAHSNDWHSDVNGPLLLWGHVAHALVLLAPTVATGHMILDDRCYCEARDTHAVATSPYSSDGHSDISFLSPLAPTVTTS